MMVHRFRSIVAAALVAAAVSATPAAAQETPPDFEGWSLPGLTFTPGIALSTRWDSNVALAGQPVDGRTAGDTLLILMPSGQLDLLTTRTQLTAGYRGALRRYTDVEELNGYDQRAYFSLRRRLTPRVTLFANDEFTAVPSTDLVELNGLPFARVGTRSNRAAAGLETRVTQLTDVRVRYENSWTEFDSTEGFFSGGTIHGASVDVRRRLTARTTVGAEGRVRRSDVTRLEPRVIWFQDAGALFEYRLSEHTSVLAAAGMSRLQDSRFDETRNDPYYRIDLHHTARRATAGIGFERSYTPSFGFSGSNDSQELRGFVRMPFSRNRFYVQSTGSWRRTNPFFAEDIRLDTFIANTTVGYSALRWFRTELFHAYSRQDSIVTGGEVDRHRIGVQVVVSQPMRIR